LCFKTYGTVYALKEQQAEEASKREMVLASSDFQLFGPLKDALGGTRCRCDWGVKNAVLQWLRAQPKSFCYVSIKKLVGRWEKCVEKQDYHIEKMMYFVFVIMNKIEL
jgi:hypothetical protein